MLWYIKQLLTIGYERLPLLTNAIAEGKSCPCSGGDYVVVVAAATAAAAAVVADDSLLIVAPIFFGFSVWSLFCYTILSAFSSFAIIMMGLGGLFCFYICLLGVF